MTRQSRQQSLQTPNEYDVIRLLQPRLEHYSDEDLYQGLLSGDGQVFDKFYRHVLPQVRRVLVLRSCPPDEADDIFQEALLALWQNARDGRYRLQSGTKMTTYLTQLCTNRWIDRTRRVAFRQTDTYDQVPESLSDEMGGEHDSALEQQYQRLDVAFAQLGERCQEMLTKFYYQKAGLAELAEQRGITEASAKTEKYRCMQRLKTLCAKPDHPKEANHV